MSVSLWMNFFVPASNLSRRKKMITLEYILIDGVNDDLKQADLLAAHANRLNAKINLIPYNRVEGLSWKRPPSIGLNRFTTE